MIVLMLYIITHSIPSVFFRTTALLTLLRSSADFTAETVSRVRDRAARYLIFWNGNFPEFFSY